MLQGEVQRADSRWLGRLVQEVVLPELKNGLTAFLRGISGLLYVKHPVEGSPNLVGEFNPV
ncbi:MAG TPA: hypothetical protein PKL84_05900, partial [Candidatus Hydrogenedentes bacterium]|nr:hypothetical protein [Candidatus Hydrogenedentota bacterium]